MQVVQTRSAKFFQALAFISFFMLLLALLQDKIYSWQHDHSFYISESVLFNTYWLLFIPVTGFLVFLNNHFSYFKNRLPLFFRAPFFVSIAALLHALLFSLLVFVLSKWLMDHHYSFKGNFNYTLGHDLYKYVLIYGFLFFIINRSKKQEIVNPALTKNTGFLVHMLVRNGRDQVSIPVQEIAWMEAASPYVKIHCSDKRFLHTETLRSLETQLNPTIFIRIHKSVIVNINQVASSRSRGNGDYDLTLQNGQILRLSRSYASRFKQVQAQHGISGF
jgi:two-component system, LytTR family, response regulator